MRCLTSAPRRNTISVRNKSKHIKSTQDHVKSRLDQLYGSTLILLTILGNHVTFSGGIWRSRIRWTLSAVKGSPLNTIFPIWFFDPFSPLRRELSVVSHSVTFIQRMAPSGGRIGARRHGWHGASGLRGRDVEDTQEEKKNSVDLRHGEAA